MAGSRARRNPLFAGKDELAGGALIDGSSITAISWAQTFALTEASALAQTPTSAPAPIISSTDKLYQQLTKTYAITVKLLEQNQAQGAGPHKKPFKVQFPDLYYRNSHLNCYRFCQQCEDHFETVEANRPNQIPFPALFLCRVVA